MCPFSISLATLAWTSLAMGAVSTVASTAISMQQAQAQIEANERTTAAAQADAVNKSQAEAERLGQVTEQTERERLKRRDEQAAIQSTMALMSERMGFRGQTAERMQRDIKAQGLRADDQLVDNLTNEGRQAGRRVDSYNAGVARTVNSLPVVNKGAIAAGGLLDLGTSTIGGLMMPIGNDNTVGTATGLVRP